MERKNYGLILQPIEIEKDYVLGGYGSLDGTQYQPDGQWDAYLPQDEVQNLFGVEPYACATFATLSCVEALIRRQFGEERNYSDRFLAAISGTAAQKGNSLQNVSETLRKQGVVREAAWPFDYLVDTFEKYYAPVSSALRTLATEFVAEFAYAHEYVPCSPEALKEALRYSPLSVAVYGWAINPATGYYHKPAGYPYNHAPVLYGYEEGKYWKLLDSYDNTHKRMDWDTQFGQAKRHKLTRQIQSEGAWRKFLRLLASLFAAPAPIPGMPERPPFPPIEPPVEPPKPPVPAPKPVPAKSKLEPFCLAVRAHEGWYAGSRSWRNNNPGNCRYSSVGYAKMYGHVGKDDKNFAVFRDYATGWLYLNNLVKAKISANPSQDFYAFFEVYAPSFENDSKHYAEVVAKACGLKATDPVSKVL